MSEAWVELGGSLTQTMSWGQWTQKLWQSERRASWQFVVKHDHDMIDAVELHFPRLPFNHGLRIADLIERVDFAGNGGCKAASMTSLDLLLGDRGGRTASSITLPAPPVGKLTPYVRSTITVVLNRNRTPLPMPNKFCPALPFDLGAVVWEYAGFYFQDWCRCMIRGASLPNLERIKQLPVDVLVPEYTLLVDATRGDDTVARYPMMETCIHVSEVSVVFKFPSGRYYSTEDKVPAKSFHTVNTYEGSWTWTTCSRGGGIRVHRYTHCPTPTWDDCKVSQAATCVLPSGGVTYGHNRLLVVEWEDWAPAGTRICLVASSVNLLRLTPGMIAKLYAA